MLTSLRILHPPSSSTNTSPHPVIILSHENHKILFNAPEGALRSLNSRKAVFSSKTGLDIYVQDATLSTRGLPGLLMSLADAQGQAHNAIHLYGPPNTAHALATARFFAKRVNRQLHVHEGYAAASTTAWPVHDAGAGTVVRPLPSWPESWQLSDVKKGNFQQSVDATDTLGRKRRRSSPELERPQTSNSGPRSNVEYDVLTFSKDRCESGTAISIGRALPTAEDMFRATEARKSLCKNTFDDPSVTPQGKSVSPAWNQNRLPHPAIGPYSGAAELPSQPIAYSYAVTLPTMLGKLDPDKAQLLGVKPGPAFGQLRNGQSITVSRPAAWKTWSDEEKRSWMTISTRGRRKKAKQSLSEQRDIQTAAATEMEEVVVESKECVSPSVPGPLILLVYVPTPDHVAAFTSNSNADVIAEAAKDLNGEVSLIVHTSPLSVLQDPRYQGWVAATSSPSTYHIMTAKGLGRDMVLYPSAALLFLRLSMLDSDMFTFPPYTLTRQADKLRSAIPMGVDPSTVTVLDTDTSVDLQPRFRAPHLTRHVAQAYVDDVTFDVNAEEGTEDHRSKLSKMAFEMPDAALDASSGYQCKEAGDETGSRQKVRREALRAAWREYCSVAEKIKADVNEIAAQEKGRARAEWDGVRVTTLGTGSAGPSKYRNVAATLVKLPGRFFAGQTDSSGPTYVLLDAGESTLGQLAQRFGSGFPLAGILTRIRMIFISHIHADHCAGVAHILRARAMLKPKQPVYLIANSFTRRFLEEWSDLEAIGLSTDCRDDGSVVILEAEHLDYETGLSVPGVEADEQDAFYLTRLKSGFVSGFEHWASKVREEVLSRPHFAALDENGLAAEDVNIAKEVRQVMEDRNSQLRGGKQPDFSQSAQNLFEYSKWADRQLTRTGLERMRADLGEGFIITTAEVDHRARHCYGVVIRINERSRADGRERDSFAFSFSGDTRPCANLEKAARGVDLFIHEATMQEDQAEEAYQRGHSTIQGAVKSGKNAGASVILLTHFSQRYPKMPRFNLGASTGTSSDGATAAESERHCNDAGPSKSVVAVGMDLLDIAMNEMWKMERYLPAIDVLFRAEAFEVDDVDGEDSSPVD